LVSSVATRVRLVELTLALIVAMIIVAAAAREPEVGRG
jgi:hypothetical protein